MTSVNSSVAIPQTSAPIKCPCPYLAPRPSSQLLSNTEKLEKFRNTRELVFSSAEALINKRRRLQKRRQPGIVSPKLNQSFSPITEMSKYSKIFIANNSRNLPIFKGEVKISLEESHVYLPNVKRASAGYLLLHVGAYHVVHSNENRPPPDSKQLLSIRIARQPGNGTAQLRKISHIPLSKPNCRVFPVSKTVAMTQFPCNFSAPPDLSTNSSAPQIDNNNMNKSTNVVWISALLYYYPQYHYVGRDEFQVEVVSRLGILNPDNNDDNKKLVSVTTAATAKLNIRVWLLSNPCGRRGKCIGPPDDPKCSHNRRSEGFYKWNYTCECHKPWTGLKCDINTEINLLSQCNKHSCVLERRCVHSNGRYRCFCHYCNPVLEPWQTALLVIGTGVAICSLTVGLIMLSKNRSAQFRDS